MLQELLATEEKSLAQLLKRHPIKEKLVRYFVKKRTLKDFRLFIAPSLFLARRLCSRLIEKKVDSEKSIKSINKCGKARKEDT